MTHEVVFAPEALTDLLRLYDTIAQDASPERASTYVERLRAFCLGLATFPERGKRRDDLRPGLRVIGYQRRVAVAFHVFAETVVIDRVLYGGRDLQRLLGEDGNA